MTLTINGTDIFPYVAYGGIKWQKSDVEGPNKGQGIDGTVIRDRIAIKRTLEITCRPLTATEASTILTLIEPEFVTVTYTDPMLGATTKTMFSNNSPATFCITIDGVDYWAGITFPLEEQ